MPTTNVSEPAKIQPKREIQLQERERSSLGRYPQQSLLTRSQRVRVLQRAGGG